MNTKIIRTRRTNYSFVLNNEVYLDDTEPYIPIELLNKWLLKEQIEEYLRYYDFRDSHNRPLTVNKFLNIIKGYGYSAIKKRKVINGRKITVYKI